MKKSNFTESQIVFILKQAEDGTAISEVCRKAGISDATFYNWRKKYAGLLPSEMRRLRQLEEVCNSDGANTDGSYFCLVGFAFCDASRSTSALILFKARS
jgi:putative transposase